MNVHVTVKQSDGHRKYLLAAGHFLGFPHLGIPVKTFHGVVHPVLAAARFENIKNPVLQGRKRGGSGGSIPTEPPLCCFIPRGLIHWMCKDDSVTMGDQMGLTGG